VTPRPRSATRRIDRGRNHEYVLDGVKCDGVTTLLNAGIPKPALVGWAARSVAEFVAGHRHVLTELTDDELVDLAKGVPYRDRDQAANRGTEVHRLAAELAVGRDVEVPGELVGHVDADLDFVKRWQPEIELVEATVINRRHRYMGTLDLVCHLPGLGRTLVDLKTNRTGPFGEVALQLVAYGRAETYLEENGGDLIERPMPAIDSYAVLWLTGDSWELYRYDVGEREWRTFLFVAEVARWLDQRAKVVRGEPLARPPAALTVAAS